MTPRLEELLELVRRVRRVREGRKLLWGNVRSELYHLSKTIPDMPRSTYQRLDGMVYGKTPRASNDLRKLVLAWLSQHDVKPTEQVFVLGEGKLILHRPDGTVHETYKVTDMSVTISKEPINAKTDGDNYRGSQRISSRVDVRLPQSILEAIGGQKHEVPDDPGD